VSEHDLGLKVAARRLLWRMGYSTRLDVPLRAVGAQGEPGDPGTARRSAPEAFTDLDVLGLTIVGTFRLQSAIVDCKTSPRGSTERMFWIRGVADFFSADTAFMVREHQVSEAARQLVARLGIAALTSEDLGRLEQVHPSSLPLDQEPLSWLFERGRAASTLSAFTDLDRKLRRLLDYRQFDYWVNEEHRNPVQLVEHLRHSARHLDSRNPLHLALVLDCAWLYLVTLSHLVEQIRAAHLADPDIGLRQYLFGGPAGLQEKQQLARLLEGLRSSGALPQAVQIDPLPEYFPALRELALRVMRRPFGVLPALRLLEVAAAFAAQRAAQRTLEVRSAVADDYAAKQAADVVGFLVSAAGLHPDFRTRARACLLAEDEPLIAETAAREASPTAARPRKASRRPAVAEQPRLLDQ
jgi:hypothetical protein